MGQERERRMMGTVDRLRAVEGDGSVPSPRADLGDALRLCAKGDQDAFAQVYDLISPKVYGLVLRVLRDPAQSEEVVQECFLEIWRNASRFDPARGSASAWIMTIAHRRAVDRVRASEADTRRDRDYGAATQPVHHDETAETAEARIEARRVRAALETLTPTQREAIELAYLGGYTHSEVAVMLDLPLGTAKTRIRDGLIRLRDTMGVGAR